MKEVYYEILADRRYSVFETEKDDIKSYCIGIDDEIIEDFTAVKEKATEFIELLISNAVSPVHLYDVALDYLSK